jgi:hypothetical protein
MVALAPSQPETTKAGYQYADACRILAGEGACIALNCSPGPQATLPLTVSARPFRRVLSHPAAPRWEMVEFARAAPMPRADIIITDSPRLRGLRPEQCPAPELSAVRHRGRAGSYRQWSSGHGKSALYDCWTSTGHRQVILNLNSSTNLQRP